MDIPSVDVKIFKYRQELEIIWQDCLTDAIQAGKEEYRKVIKTKNVTSEKFGQCTVIVDGE